MFRIRDVFIRIRIRGSLHLHQSSKITSYWYKLLKRQTTVEIKVVHKFFCFLSRVADPDPSGSGLDPDSIGSVDPDPDSECGSRRAKKVHKSKFFFLKFMFSSVGWPLLIAEGFFCNFDVLYGGLIGKL